MRLTVAVLMQPQHGLPEGFIITMTAPERDDVRLVKSLDEIWAKTQEILSKKMSHAAYQMSLRHSQLSEIKDGVATIGVIGEFARTMVVNQQNIVADALFQITAERLTILPVIDPTVSTDSYTPNIGSITVSPPAPAYSDSEEDASFAPAAASPFNNPTTTQRVNSPARNSGSGGNAPGMASNGGLSRANLNPKHQFDSFVVGSHNRFCHSASLAVAERPGQAYNPLFIYGGVGLGKTHLMQGIGHEILKHSPNLSVRYISCERFTNELIHSIRDDRMMDFRKRYRQVDVLLVDDIQFIQGKESTQEEFFHTFNALRDSGRQIVLSSDRPPKAMTVLEERLRSRFEWGLIADIQAPDLETRVAILQKKCDIEGMRVSAEVLEYIATVFKTNIRELEGALIRAHAYASLAGAPLTPASLAEILQPVEPHQVQKAPLTIEKITDTVAAFYRVESSELRSSKRSQDLALPRHIAMYLAHELIQMSFPRIGQSFGNRKHTSAIYAHQRIKEASGKDPVLAVAISQIKQLLTA
jgi:chromosomal replication initiator protein